MRMRFDPTLATNSVPRARRGRCVLEPKFDGRRCVVAIDDGGVARVWTRRGHEPTEQASELAPLADVVDARVVLDDEPRPRQLSRG